MFAFGICKNRKNLYVTQRFTEAIQRTTEEIFILGFYMFTIQIYEPAGSLSIFNKFAA